MRLFTWSVCLVGVKWDPFPLVWAGDLLCLFSLSPQSALRGCALSHPRFVSPIGSRNNGKNQIIGTFQALLCVLCAGGWPWAHSLHAVASLRDYFLRWRWFSSLIVICASFLRTPRHWEVAVGWVTNTPRRIPCPENTCKEPQKLSFTHLPLFFIIFRMLSSFLGCFHRL